MMRPSSPNPQQKGIMEAMGFEIGLTNHESEACWKRGDIYLVCLASRTGSIADFVGMVLDIAKARGKNLKLIELREAYRGDPLGQIPPGR
jgi:hypothetical protein